MRNLKIVGVALVMLVVLQSVNKDNPKKVQGPKAFDLNNINNEVAPCEIFYSYAIGNWQKNKSDSSYRRKVDEF